MTIQTIRIQLSEDLYQRFQGLAAATNQPLEEVVSQAIRGNAPPSLDDVSPALRDLVADLPSRGTEELWAIVGEPLPQQRQRRHRRLLATAHDRTLTAAEQAELVMLRETTDRSVIRRSYALALLKWRGHLPVVES